MNVCILTALPVFFSRNNAIFIPDQERSFIPETVPNKRLFTERERKKTTGMQEPIDNSSYMIHFFQLFLIPFHSIPIMDADSRHYFPKALDSHPHFAWSEQLCKKHVAFWMIFPISTKKVVNCLKWKMHRLLLCSALCSPLLVSNP